MTNNIRNVMIMNHENFYDLESHYEKSIEIIDYWITYSCNFGVVPVESSLYWFVATHGVIIVQF